MHEAALWVPIGDAAILSLTDGWIPRPGTDHSLIPVNAFLVRSMGRLILVDSGFGDKWTEEEPDLVRPGGSIVDGLRRAGVSPEDVELVINTHLHVDHAGGDTRFDPTRVTVAAFPNASYVIQAAEWSFAMAPGRWSFLFRQDDFVPLTASGHLRLIDGPLDVTDEVRCVPRPGHTPGHQVVEVVSQGQMAILVGDALQSDAQVRDASIESQQDVDASQAAATRDTLIGRASEREAWLGMAHAGNGIRRFGLIGREATAADA